jgi:hypothetical protein
LPLSPIAVAEDDDEDSKYEDELEVEAENDNSKHDEIYEETNSSSSAAALPTVANIHSDLPENDQSLENFNINLGPSGSKDLNFNITPEKRRKAIMEIVVCSPKN